MDSDCASGANGGGVVVGIKLMVLVRLVSSATYTVRSSRVCCIGSVQMLRHGFPVDLPRAAANRRNVHVHHGRNGMVSRNTISEPLVDLLISSGFCQTWRRRDEARLN